jgi:hypothetical protein
MRGFIAQRPTTEGGEVERRVGSRHYGNALSAKSRYSRTVHASTPYNSAILSRLLTKCEASGNEKIHALLKKTSPAAWCHIHLNGHYTFHGDGHAIDWDAIVAGLELG